MLIEILIKNRNVTLSLKNGKKVVDLYEFVEEMKLSEELLIKIDQLLEKNQLTVDAIEKISVKSDLDENWTTTRIAKTVANAWNYVNAKA